MTTVLPARRRRTHTIEFKTELVAMCRQPGISVSAVALAHNVNTNLLRRWIKQFPVDARFPVVEASGKLVAVQVAPLADVPNSDTIEINLRQHNTHMSIRWPGTLAKECGEWLKALIR